MKITKSISAFTLICFIASSFAYAQILPWEASVFSIPKEWGTIEETSHGNSAETVVLIQDAHCNFDAQVNTQKIIGYFQEKYHVSHVAFEGSTGKLDLLALKAFPDTEVKKKVFEKYVRRGELSGVELAALLNSVDSDYIGIEDPKMYQANKAAFLEALAARPKFASAHRKILLGLNRIRKQIYSKELLEFTAVKPERDDRFHPDLLNYLRKHLPAFEINMAYYPNVQKLLKYSEGKKATPRSYKSINNRQLFSEMNALTAQIKAKLFRNEDQRTLDMLYRHLKILKNMSELKLTRAELVEYRTHRFEFLPETYQRFFNLFGIKENVRFNLSPAERFYDIALQRDKILFSNLRKAMSSSHQKFAVLVAGGFHTEGIKSRLKASGISYIAITPAIKKSSDPAIYLNAMKGKFSYLNQRRSEKMEKALHVDAGEMINLIEKWRSGILDALVRKGEVRQSDKYTSVIDDAFQSLTDTMKISSLAVEAASLGAHRKEFISAVADDLIGEIATRMAAGELDVKKLRHLLDKSVNQLIHREKSKNGKQLPELHKIKEAIPSDVETLDRRLRAVQNLDVHGVGGVIENGGSRVQKNYLKDMKSLKGLLAQGLTREEFFKEADQGQTADEIQSHQIVDFLKRKEVQDAWRDPVSRLLVSGLLFKKLLELELSNSISDDVRLHLVPGFLELSSEERESIRKEARTIVAEKVHEKYGVPDQNIKIDGVRPEIKKAISEWKKQGGIQKKTDQFVRYLILPALTPEEYQLLTKTNQGEIGIYVFKSDNASSNLVVTQGVDVNARVEKDVTVNSEVYNTRTIARTDILPFADAMAHTHGTLKKSDTLALSDEEGFGDLISAVMSLAMLEQDWLVTAYQGNSLKAISLSENSLTPAEKSSLVKIWQSGDQSRVLKFHGVDGEGLSQSRAIVDRLAKQAPKDSLQALEAAGILKAKGASLGDSVPNLKEEMIRDGYVSLIRSVQTRLTADDRNAVGCFTVAKEVKEILEKFFRVRTTLKAGHFEAVERSTGEFVRIPRHYWVETEDGYVLDAFPEGNIYALGREPNYHDLIKSGIVIRKDSSLAVRAYQGEDWQSEFPGFEAREKLIRKIQDQRQPPSRSAEEWTRAWQNPLMKVKPGLPLNTYNGYIRYLWKVMKEIAPNYQAGLPVRVIDVGSGEGDLANFVQQILGEITRSEPNVWTVDFADLFPLNPDHHIKASVTDLPFGTKASPRSAPRNFDLAIASLLLEYLKPDERVKALREINRVLDSNHSAYALVMLHHPDAFVSKQFRSGDQFTSYPETHNRFENLSRNDLEKIAEQADFEIVSFEEIDGKVSESSVNKACGALLKKKLDVSQLKSIPEKIIADAGSWRDVTLDALLDIQYKIIGLGLSKEEMNVPLPQDGDEYRQILNLGRILGEFQLNYDVKDRLRALAKRSPQNWIRLLTVIARVVEQVKAQRITDLKFDINGNIDSVFAQFEAILSSDYQDLVSQMISYRFEKTGGRLSIVLPTFIILNKPAGYVSTGLRSETEPRVIADLLPHYLRGKVWMAGRLDKATEGLMIFSNYNQVNELIKKPKSEKGKTYRAVVQGLFTGQDAEKLRTGVTIIEERKKKSYVTKKKSVEVKALNVQILKSGERDSEIEITIREGLYHQVKKMLVAVGHPVKYLERTSIYGLQIGDLKLGEWRYLKPEELIGLLGSIGFEHARGASLGQSDVIDRMKAIGADASQYLAAFDRIIKSKSPPLSLNKSLALAIHINSLPDAMSPLQFQTLLHKLGENGKMFLVLPKDKNSQDKANRLISYLQAGQKNQVKRVSYGSEIPVKEVDQEFRRLKGLQKIFVADSFEAFADKLAAMKAKAETVYYELDADKLGFLADPILSLIVDFRDGEMLSREFQGSVRKSNGGNGFQFFYFDLAAFVNLLGEEIQQTKLLEKAA